jgi:hypothetical protein
VDSPDNPSRAELSRLLVAADPEVDPHRLVGLCCGRTTGDAVSVSLLVPADDESGARADRSAQAASGRGGHVSRSRARRMLVLALASSAGVHAALVPTHASEASVVGALFALSALALAGVALHVDHSPRRGAPAAAALLLGSLLVAYAATRVLPLPPSTHAEPIDAVGAATKLVEAAGLLLALRLLHTPAGSARRSPRYEKELAHEQ